MVHDEFIARLHDNFKKTYGLEIANIRVESFKIMNAELADNISKQAIITAQTENRLANLEGQRQIATAEMERDSAVALIKAQAASQQFATEVQARNTAAIADAQSKAQSVKIVAQGTFHLNLFMLLTRSIIGEAESMLIKAEAEARAIELKASAEKKRAQVRKGRGHSNNIIQTLYCNRIWELHPSVLSWRCFPFKVTWSRNQLEAFKR